MGFSSGFDDDFYHPYHSHEDTFDSFDDDRFKFDHDHHDDSDDNSFPMDIFIPIVVCFVIFLLCTICGVCCRKKRNAGAVFSYFPDVWY